MNDKEQWQFVRIVRQPSGFGVSWMTIRHPEKGSITVPLWESELLRLAQEALAAMKPSEDYND